MFTILYRSFGRRRLIPITQIFTTVEICAIKLIHHVGFEGMRIGEATRPGHDYGDAGLVQRMRAQLGEAAGGQPVTPRKAKSRATRNA